MERDEGKITWLKKEKKKGGGEGERREEKMFLG